MLGYFDFKEALTQLFADASAIRDEDLACLASTKLAIDFSSILQMHLRSFTTEPDKMFSLETFILNLKEKLEKWDISFMIVFGGLESQTTPELINSAIKMNKNFWKCNYFSTIYRMMSDPHDLGPRLKNISDGIRQARENLKK